jgi:xanthine dehydrogenase accessory factor
MKSAEEWIYEEEFGFKNRLFIVGGGHCALALSKIMATMDFYLHMFEERKELNTYDSNTFVDEKMIVSGYSELQNFIPSGKNNYVVIMTFGYRTDDIALRSLIGNDYKYLGVLGSESKMKKMFEEWRKDGLPEEKLNKIHAPVGINVNSRTPEEIAISIAAEIIGVKNNSLII